MTNPSLPDLLKDVTDTLGSDNEYFLVTIVDLDLATTYPIQLRWKYKNAAPSENWSAVYNVITQTSTSPNTPQLQVSDVVGDAGFIKVTWSGNDSSGNPITNIDRVDVHIAGSSFGDGTKPAGNFKKSGTLTFAATPGEYIVQLKAYRLNGASSFFSTSRTVTVTSAGETIQSPTLPSGITVATAPFAVTVNWDGSYSSSTFTGFKSIDIYAIGSDLGSSATSGITSTNLIGSLTVNDIPNKINISLDNLRQALGLSTNSDVYNATIFYYYNATNKSGTKYGSPTYTRINSSSIVPTKANFIDLASGVISIENLVAGNGSFSSWLRTGTAGGSRIELSAVSDFSNGGNTVQKGLVAYSSGNTEIFNLDIDAGTLTINGSGTFSGSLSAASGTFTGALNIGTASGGLYPFSVSSSGVLRAISGTIGGLTLSASSLSNSGGTFALDSSGKARFGSSLGNAIIIDPAAAVGSAYIYHSSNGGSSTSGKFTVATDGTLTATGGSFSGTITNGSDYWNSNGTFRFGGSSGINYNGSSITLGSSGNPITINTSTGSLSIGGTISAGSIVLSNGDYWNIGSGFQLGGTSGIRFAGSTISIGSAGNTISINTSTGNVSISGSLQAATLSVDANNFWTSSGFKLGGDNGIRYISGGSIVLGTSGNPVTINSSGNVSISGMLTVGNLTDGVTQISGSNILTGTITGIEFNNGSGTFKVTNSGVLTASSGTIGGWTIGQSSYLTNNSDVWLHPGTGYTTGGQSSTTFSIITTRQIFAAGITVQGDIGLTGTLTAATALQSNGTFTSVGLITGTGGMNLSGTLSLISGNAFVKNAANTSYLESNRLRVVGDGSTSGSGTIYADFLGTGTGTAIIQTSGGFLRVSSSSIRYKENIQEINKSGYLNIINQLKPVTFNYKQEFAPDDYNLITSGLIAEDVDLIDELKTIVNYNKNGEPESISYDRLSAMLVLAIKEIKDKIDNIEKRLDALEG